MVEISSIPKYDLKFFNNFSKGLTQKDNALKYSVHTSTLEQLSNSD